VNSHRVGARGLWDGRGHDELEQFWQRAAGQQSILTGLPQALDDIANSLVDYRVWNDDTQQAIKDKIKTVVDDLGVVGIVLVIGSILTDGGLAVPIAEVAAVAETGLVVGGAVAVVRGIEPAIQVSMSGTPNPNVEGIDATKISSDLGGDTQPTRLPDPNAKPGGHPTRIPSRARPDNKLQLQRENESAEVLEKAGYHTEQNPSKLPNGKEPDYLIEGKIFDNYAPTIDNPRSIVSYIEKNKILTGQADRVVLNLTDSSVDLDTMRAQLHDWPIKGLKEVIAIDKQGNILHLYP
jgi:hypothetical protein